MGYHGCTFTSTAPHKVNMKLFMGSFTYEPCERGNTGHAYYILVWMGRWGCYSSLTYPRVPIVAPRRLTEETVRENAIAVPLVTYDFMDLNIAPQVSKCALSRITYFELTRFSACGPAARFYLIMDGVCMPPYVHSLIGILIFLLPARSVCHSEPRRRRSYFCFRSHTSPARHALYTSEGSRTCTCSIIT